MRHTRAIKRRIESSNSTDPFLALNEISNSTLEVQIQQRTPFKWLFSVFNSDLENLDMEKNRLPMTRQNRGTRELLKLKDLDFIIRVYSRLYRMSYLA